MPPTHFSNDITLVRLSRTSIPSWLLTRPLPQFARPPQGGRALDSLRSAIGQPIYTKNARTYVNNSEALFEPTDPWYSRDPRVFAAGSDQPILMTLMANVTIGNVRVRISPAATMKCMIGLNAWHTYSEFREHEDVAGFCMQLCAYVMARPDDAGLAELAAAVAQRIAKLQRAHETRTPAIDVLGQQVRSLLRDQSRREVATHYATLATGWFERFMDAPYRELALRALGHLERIGARLPGVRPFRDAYAAIRPPELNITGQYVPWLSAVAVQMDAIMGSPFAEIEFIETLLHEQVHAIIHERMRDQGEHYLRLPWFNELTAILLSQYAVGRAFADMRGEPALKVVPQALRLARQQQEWGDLASAVLTDTQDPLVTWRAWQEIFARGRYRRRNYAHRDVLPEIVRRAGWAAEFPFHYGARSVDCRDDLAL